MKYLSSAPFSSKAASDDYRANHEATFGATAKPCGWCGGTGVVDVGKRAEWLVAETEPCPKGCEAPKD